MFGPLLKAARNGFALFWCHCYADCVQNADEDYRIYVVLCTRIDLLFFHAQLLSQERFV